MGGYNPPPANDFVYRTGLSNRERKKQKHENSGGLSGEQPLHICFFKIASDTLPRHCLDRVLRVVVLVVVMVVVVVVGVVAVVVVESAGGAPRLR